MKKKNWMKIAQAIAKSKGWVAWIETIMMIEEGSSEEVPYFQTAFKIRKEPEHCPHCGKAIWHSIDGINDYIFVNDPQNIIEYDKDPNKAWKLLVMKYAKVFKKTIAEIELELTIKGLL